MTTWWTSDTHFSHANIIRYAKRPFADVAEMNAELVARWNALVAPTDVVWHLGDLALGQDIEQQVAMTSTLHGRRRLVPGNHDRVASFFEGGDQRERFWSVYEAAGWEIMPEALEHQIEGHRVLSATSPTREIRTARTVTAPIGRSIVACRSFTATCTRILPNAAGNSTSVSMCGTSSPCRSK